MTKESKLTGKYSGWYVIRLIKGDIPLVITFWLYGFIPNSLFKLLANFMSQNSIHIILSDREYLFDLYSYIYYPFIVFMWIATWNSASKYKGKIWGTIAKLLVIIGVIYTVLTVVGFSQSAAIKEEISNINKELPIMVTSDIEFMSASTNDDGVHFNYRLVDVALADVDVPSFKEEIQKSSIETACNDKDIHMILKELDKIHYIYVDQNKNLIAEVILTIKDCL